MKFPVFSSKSELENSIWSKYFIHIYGEIPDSDYPIDLNTFWILYTNILEKYNIVLTDKCIKDKNCYSICPKDNGDLYSNMSHANDMNHTIWIYHKPPFKALSDNSIVEIIHTSGGYLGQKMIESTGSWMYYAKGSGIYFDIGKSISFVDHSESVKYFLDIDISCPLREECAYYFRDVFTKAKNMGYDSIQYLKHYDMRCGDTSIEIIDLHGIGAYPCGNKTTGNKSEYNIKSGWKGKNKCICDNHKQSVNCKIIDNIIGGYDVTKPDNFNFNSMKYYLRSYKNIYILILIYIILIYTLYKYIIRKNKILKKHILLWTILLILFSMLIYLYLILYRFQ
jgi:hypothetical protein